MEYITIYLIPYRYVIFDNASFDFPYIDILYLSAYSPSLNEVSIVSDASKMDDKAYEPNPLTIKQGDTVKRTNYLLV